MVMHVASTSPGCPVCVHLASSKGKKKRKGSLTATSISLNAPKPQGTARHFQSLALDRAHHHPTPFLRLARVTRG